MEQVTQTIEQIRDEFLQTYGFSWNTDPQGRYVPFLESVIVASVEKIMILKKPTPETKVLKGSNSDVISNLGETKK